MAAVAVVGFLVVAVVFVLVILFVIAVVVCTNAVLFCHCFYCLLLLVSSCYLRSFLFVVRAIFMLSLLDYFAII